MQSFTTKEEAEDWMVEQVDETYIDNFRFAFLDDDIALAAYTKQQDNGCCGFFDEEVEVGGRPATIGCNYGH